MGNRLGNPTIDRHHDSRQRRPQSWYPHLKSFGTAVIEVSEIENYLLLQCSCYPESFPCVTSTPAYRGSIRQQSTERQQHTGKTDRRMSRSGCEGQTQNVNLPEIVLSEATSNPCVNPQVPLPARPMKWHPMGNNDPHYKNYRSTRCGDMGSCSGLPRLHVWFRRTHAPC